jgi:PLP dependent protein
MVQERIAAACARAGRDGAEVEILAAVKYVAVDAMGALAEAGITVVGENTAQALIAKQERWGERFTWDFIGHLQSRKTKDVLPRVRLIHSVESDSVVERIERHAQQPARVLLEVNAAGEESKNGVPLAEVDAFVERASRGDKVVFGGLMTMPPSTEQPEEARPHFARLRELRDRLRAEWGGRHDFTVLSMGTTQDYEVAVEEGATIVRLGSVLYV